MSVEYFFDTNILLYGYDLDAPEKRLIAGNILKNAWEFPETIAVSVQVLQEFFVNFTRKGQEYSEARLLVEDFCHWKVVENSLSLFGSGLAIRERWQLSLWDALIVAAAEFSGADKLLTEDLNHGQYYGKVMVINPFLDNSIKWS